MSKKEPENEGKVQRTRNATNLINVFHNVLSTWFEVSDEGRAVRYGLEIIDCQLDSYGLRNGNKMQNGIR